MSLFYLISQVAHSLIQGDHAVVGGHRTPPAPVAPTTYGTIVGYRGADGYREPQVELYDKSARLNGPRMMVSYAYEGDR
ncbi:MAG: hypothetical protein ACJ8CR_37830 [Roseiflexaceae bacterium]